VTDFVDLVWIAALVIGFVVAPIAIVVVALRKKVLLRGLAVAALSVLATGVLAAVLLFSAAVHDLIRAAIPEPQPPPAELWER
jgi:hypothetical protein